MDSLDLKLNGHLSTFTVFSGLSEDKKNDPHSIDFYNILLETLKSEIERTDFVSIIVTGEITDFMSKSQFHTVLQSMINEDVKERFLGLI